MFPRLLVLLLVLWAVPAQARFLDSYRYGAPAANRCAALGDTVTSTVFDLDATCSSSYSGSGQVFANLETTPADSSAQSAYNFDIGASNSATTDDPTFVGSAGDAAAYFSLDGGDLFELNGSVTQFIKDWAKTVSGQDFWVAIVFKQISGAGVQGVSADTTSTTTAGGVYVNLDATEHPVLNLRGDATLATQTFSGSTLSNDTWYVMILSYTHASTGTAALWLNSATGTTAGLTLNAYLGAEITTQLHFGKSTSQFLNSGTFVREIAAGNTYLDNTEAGKIITVMETRCVCDLTP